MNFERREMRKKIISIILVASFFVAFGLLGNVGMASAVGSKVSIRSMDINDFVAEGYTEKINKITSDLNVAKTSYNSCNVSGMTNSLAGGIEVNGEGFVDTKGKEIKPENAKAAMLYNTWVLQSLMDCAYNLAEVVDENGGVKAGMEKEAKKIVQDRLESSLKIILPAGTYYFVAGGAGAYGHYVIRQASGVNIVGSGGKKEEEKGKSDELTTLKPYSRPGEFADKGNTGGLDMFHHNLLLDSCNFLANGEIHCKIMPEYAYNNIQIESCSGVSRFKYGDDWYYKSGNDASEQCMREALYLEDADYKSFVIDSAQAKADEGGYNTSGKGFMLDVVRNSDWDNLVVRNTDGTCFAMDNPVNGTISNSKAENCGKMADRNSGGASGFGIGTGYSDKGSLKISGSSSSGNTKFGYFFENQSRFEEESHIASEAASNDAYQVVDSYAENNLYNFGGLRANDTKYVNNTSKAGEKTKLHIFFDDESRRINVGQTKLEDYPSYFEDVSKDAYYYDAVLWAEEHGITNGVKEYNGVKGEKGAIFGVGQQLMRQDAIIMMWRAEKRPGDVISTREPGVRTCFQDVSQDAYYAEAVKWGYDNHILNGTVACNSDGSGGGLFSPEKTLSRAEFITMLWRLAGEPKAASGKQFDDITDESAYYYQATKWARSKGIVNGTSEGIFKPDADCTREQAVTMLYRYYN